MNQASSLMASSNKKVLEFKTESENGNLFIQSVYKNILAQFLYQGEVKKIVLGSDIDQKNSYEIKIENEFSNAKVYFYFVDTDSIMKDKGSFFDELYRKAHEVSIRSEITNFVIVLKKYDYNLVSSLTQLLEFFKKNSNFRFCFSVLKQHYLLKYETLDKLNNKMIIFLKEMFLFKDFAKLIIFLSESDPDRNVQDAKKRIGELWKKKYSDSHVFFKFLCFITVERFIFGSEVI